MRSFSNYACWCIEPMATKAVGISHEAVKSQTVGVSLFFMFIPRSDILSTSIYRTYTYLIKHVQILSVILDFSEALSSFEWKTSEYWTVFKYISSFLHMHVLQNRFLELTANKWCTGIFLMAAWDKYTV